MSMKTYLLVQYNSILKYIFISLFTATVEAIIGFYLVSRRGINIIEANTFSVLMGTIIHYLLISKKVFGKKYSLWTLIVYIATFILGIILQNIVIYFSYEYFLLNSTPYFRYMGSKLLSITIPFGIVYSIRKKLYLMR